jgi:hypothetical protein
MEDCTLMSEDELFSSLEQLARDERRNLPAILSRLAELDARDSAIKKNPSLFSYCLRTLRWSESETARRIHVARKARQYHAIYGLLASGRLSLSSASVLAPHLTGENHRALLARAKGRSVREVEALVAELAPREEKRERIRAFMPPPTPPSVSSEAPLFCDPPAPASVGDPASRPSVPAPPAQRSIRVEFTFTADEALAREVEDARALLRHKYPFCRLEDLFREAVGALLLRLDPERRPAPAPRLSRRAERSRSIPPSVRAVVWRRDGGRCSYVGQDGRRCLSRAFLELDHVRPFALGGASHDAANLRLLCRGHNIHASRDAFGFI